MTRILYLLRHAHSADNQHHQRDKERELSVTGIKEAMRIGSWLAKNNTTLDLICCSSAIRTIMTSEIVGKALKLPTEKIIPNDFLYEATARGFLNFIQDLSDGLINVMIVGHNPTISYIAEYLTKETVGMSTGSMAIIRLDSPSWKETDERTGKLINYIEPGTINMTNE